MPWACQLNSAKRRVDQDYEPIAVAVDGDKAVQPPYDKTWRREANSILGAPQTY